MAERFTVDLDQVSSAVAAMKEFTGYLEKVTAEIDTRVKSLHTSWDGDTSQAHVLAHRTWMTNAETMRRALVSMTDSATVAHENYSGAVNVNEQIWNITG